MSKEAILLACERIGGQTALAKALGLRSQGSISRWIATGRVPAERVLDIEEKTRVSRHELRPDLYPLEDSSLATN
jgi:DNA-binding transcriptional regulator YdaS (Cro superfamily)